MLFYIKNAILMGIVLSLSVLMFYEQYSYYKIRSLNKQLNVVLEKGKKEVTISKIDNNFDIKNQKLNETVRDRIQQVKDQILNQKITNINDFVVKSKCIFDNFGTQYECK